MVDFRLVVSGLRLLWDGVSFLEMTVPPKYRAGLCGLCGNFNGISQDDFMSKSGLKQFTDSQHFGDAWRVGGMRACSVLPKDMPHSYEPQCVQSWDARIKSDRFCNALKSSLFASCASKVDPDYYFKACELDMCECPGEQCHCEVLTAYARECERAGVLVYNWREATGCKNITSYKYSQRHPNEVLKMIQPQQDQPKIETESFAETTTQEPASIEAEKTTIVADLTTSSTTELPEWILGPYLPGCSRETQRFCQNQKRQRSSAAKKRKAEKRARARRRRLRKQQKQLRRRQRKEQRRKLRRQQKKKKKEKKKFDWTKIFGPEGMKRPPFEALLHSTADESTTTEETFLNPASFSSESTSFWGQQISSSDFESNKKRTPLPLKEAASFKSSGLEDQRGRPSWTRRKRKSDWASFSRKQQRYMWYFYTTVFLISIFKCFAKLKRHHFTFFFSWLEFIVNFI